MFAVLTSSVVFGASFSASRSRSTKCLRRRQVLDHVEQQHVVEVAEIQRRQAVVEIVQDERVQLHARSERKLVDAGDAAAVAAGAASRRRSRRRSRDRARARPAGTSSSAAVCGLA